MEPSRKRFTLVFSSVYVVGLVSVGALGAVLLGRTPSLVLRELFTDPGWLFNCVFVFLLVVWLYPRHERIYRERTG